MPNIAIAFRQEITRLARREIRSQIQGIRRASAQYRKDIAGLKRQVSESKSKIASLERGANGAGADQNAEADQPKIRFSARGVASHRNALGVSAADYGKLVGVTAHTVYKWEHGSARPRSAQLSALASIRQLSKKDALGRLDEKRASARKGRAKKRPGS